jgi:hypothetical protein
VRLIQNGVDFSPARLGVEEKWKFHLSIQTKIPDPKTPVQWIDGEPLEYHYLDHDPEALAAFDFNNRKNITALSSWRSQHRYRKFPPTRKERAFWLEVECAKITHLITEQLKTSNTIKWKRLANEFNEENRGKIRK